MTDNSPHNWAAYNATDCTTTSRIWNQISPDIEKQGHLDIMNLQDDLCEALLYFTERGIVVDKAAVDEISTRVVAEIKGYQEDLNKIVGYDLNVSSPKQCVQYFYGVLGLPPYTSRQSGNPTCDDKAMARIARKNAKGSEAAKKVQLVRGLSKLQSTYLTVVVDDDGRLRSSFNPRGTKNGRLASRQTIFKTGMNFQNIDPRFKGFMVADPGCMFGEIDKAQAEWVVSAYASGDEEMIHVIESGVDPHAYTGHRISGLPVEIVSRENKIIGHATDPVLIEALRLEHMPELFDGTFGNEIFLPRIFSCRQAGKKSNHGLNYMMEYKRFALENEMMERDAKPIVELYRSTYIGLTRWWSTTESQVRTTRALTNCFNRTRRFLDQYSHNLLMDAVAYIPQSTVADLVNMAIISTYKDHRDFMLKGEMLTQTHDSILNQYPVGDWESMARYYIQQVEYLDPEMSYDGRTFRIGSDMKTGTNWGEYNSETNPCGMKEIPLSKDVTTLANTLKERYEEIRDSSYGKKAN